MASDLFAPKVVMETTMGAITMELYVKQSPKTCRNFLELSRRGYYDQVKFHRVIKDFMVQGGDPTGTGRWGESIYGPKVEDEVTRELKHTGAGIMSMGGSNLGTLSRSCEEGELKEAVEALDILVQQDFYVDNYLFYCVLKKCIENKDLVMGRRVHALALRCGYGSSSFVANHIIRMYGCHGLLEEAMHVFSQVTEPTCRMWASIILAHAEHGQAKLAIQLYRDMRKSTLKPNSYVFVAALKACAIAVDLESGKRVYADMCGTVAEHDLFVANCVVDMFSKCGSLQDARRVFDRLSTKDVVTWNVMIAGYAQQGLGQEALALYEDMQQQSITAANRITFVCLLQACASIGALQEGRQLHIEIEKKGLEADVFVGNSLVNLYAKCGNLDNARKVFDKMPTRDVVTWNTMIAGYVQQGLGQEALALYARMQQGGISWANHVTFVCLLQACASLGAVHQGKQLHAQIEEQGLEADVVVGNSLVDMYAKCGSLEDARRVFDMMSTRTVVTWTALLNGYAQHSDGQMAIECFKEMCQQGVKPDDTTYNCLLIACSHAGLVYEGQRYFKMMVDKHGIEPTDDLYNCLVDLLGRSGHLEEAENLLDSLPLEKHFVGWTSLLSACKTYGDMDRGRRCFGYLTSMEPQNASPYMLLASIYANAGMWGDLDRIERLRKSVCAEKKPAKACIEVKHKIHEFIVGDKASGMSSKLKNVGSMLKQEGGHVPHTDLVLKAVSEQDKEDTLCGHAEKLALAYGLLNTPEGTALLVTKNLRMCNDCHSSTKVMSRVEKREIVVRDSHRVHRFLDGYCSCGDRH